MILLLITENNKLQCQQFKKTLASYQRAQFLSKTVIIDGKEVKTVAGPGVGDGGPGREVVLGHPAGDGLPERGDADEVVALVRIGGEVVEAVPVPDAVVEDVLVPTCADGECGWCCGKIPFPVILVQDVVSPIRPLAAQQGQK